MTPNWLEKITTDSKREVANRIGRDHSAVSRAASAATPPPRLVVDVARAYDANPITALRDAGFLTVEEVERYDADKALTNTPTIDLLFELVRREGGKPQ